MCGTHWEMKIQGPLFKNLEEFQDGDSMLNQIQGPLRVRPDDYHGHTPTKPALTVSCCLLPLILDCSLLFLPFKSGNQLFLFVIVYPVLLSILGIK